MYETGFILHTHFMHIHTNLAHDLSLSPHQRVHPKWNELSGAWATKILFGFPLSLFAIKYNVWFDGCVRAGTSAYSVFHIILLSKCFWFGQWTKHCLSHYYCSRCVRFGIGIIAMFCAHKIHPLKLILYVTSTQHELTIIKFPILVACCSKAATPWTAPAAQHYQVSTRLDSFIWNKIAIATTTTNKHFIR